MRKRNAVKKLGRKSSNRKSLIKSQLITLFTNGKLETTSVKAKVMKANAQSIIESVKNSTDALALYRSLFSTFCSTTVVSKTQKYVAEATAGVKIVKVGFRKGDNAELSELTLIDFTKVFPKKDKKNLKTTDSKIEGSSKADKSVKKDSNITEKISKTLTQTFTGKKERARSRSGL